MAIHPTAVVSPKARLADSVEVGAYAVIGDDVELGPGCQVMHHASVQGPSQFGTNNLIHPFTCIGHKTQDLKYVGEPTHLVVGNDNEFREFCTVHRGSGPGEETRIGNHNLFLAYSHVAHNCQVGDHCILSNNGTLGGHVIAEDYCIVSGLAAVHQFCRIGRFALIGGCTKIVQDVPPYFIADGNPALVRAVNQVGLQRNGFRDEQIAIIRRAYKKLYLSKSNMADAIKKLRKEYPDNADIAHLLQFIESSERGIIRR